MCSYLQIKYMVAHLALSSFEVVVVTQTILMHGSLPDLIQWGRPCKQGWRDIRWAYLITVVKDRSWSIP